MAVYFVLGLTTGQIKIGHSVSLKTRLRLLCVDVEEPLQVLAILPGARSDEQELHRRFHATRVNGRGLEWFHDGPEIRAFIAALDERHRPLVPVFRRVRPYSPRPRLTSEQKFQRRIVGFVQRHKHPVGLVNNCRKCRWLRPSEVEVLRVLDARSSRLRAWPATASDGPFFASREA